MVDTGLLIENYLGKDETAHFFTVSEGDINYIILQ